LGTLVLKCFYVVLEIQRVASDDDVKKAFKRLALAVHPDRNPGDAAAEEKFKAINEAHAVLSDPEKRDLYDEFGHVGLATGFDVVEGRATKLFRERANPRPGDRLVPLVMTDEEMKSGKWTKTQQRRTIECPTCAGSGASVEWCDFCGGTGVHGIREDRCSNETCTIYPWSGCEACEGTGRAWYRNACPSCDGRCMRSVTCPACAATGWIEAIKTPSVRIPPGRPGAIVRIPDTTQTGDLYVYRRPAKGPAKAKR
jgi:molecular chaperone DnaJ